MSLLDFCRNRCTSRRSRPEQCDQCAAGSRQARIFFAFVTAIESWPQLETEKIFDSRLYTTMYIRGFENFFRIQAFVVPGDATRPRQINWSRLSHRPERDKAGRPQS